MNKETVETIRERIRKYRSNYERNEQAVREHLVSPILRGLGWDTENPEEVQPNVSTEGEIPDYSLLKGGKLVLFIETKNLSTDLEKKDVILQLVDYCSHQGVNFGVLTNGSVWVLYRAFQEGTRLAERRVWKIDIENDDIATIISKLNTISKQGIDNIATLIEKQQVLDKIREFLQQPTELVKGFVPVFDRLIKEKYQGYQFDTSEIEDFVEGWVTELLSSPEEYESESEPVETETGGEPRPTQMKIGTNTYKVSKWNEILVNTAEWLIKERKLKSPIAVGPKRYLINDKPMRRDGSKFSYPKRLSNGMYIELKYDKRQCEEQARRLLEKCGYSRDMLVLT